MAGKELENRIFVGGLSRDVTERQLENTFRRFGKIIDSQVMLERDSGRPRGFGFVTFSDRRGMEDAIREMHGRKFGDRVISVNKAVPKLGEEDPGHGYAGGYSTGVRASYGGGDRSAGQDNCFKCGRPGHWARDCPSAGGGRGGGPFSSNPRYGDADGHGDKYGKDHDRFAGDRYDKGRYGDRERYESRDYKLGSRDYHVNERYTSGGQFPGERYGSADRYPQNGYGKERGGYDRNGGSRGTGDSRGMMGGPGGRFERRSYRDREGPYDRPRREGHPAVSDRF